jgi:hypothetical protein
MSTVLPVVRYLVLCEDVHADQVDPQRITLVGLISTLRSLEEPPYPILKQEICAYLQVTGCRGAAQGHVEIRHADSDEVVYRTRTRTIPLVTDPLEVVGIAFRLRDCLFPKPGLYWVEFWYNDEVLAQQPLLMR